MEKLNIFIFIVIEFGIFQLIGCPLQLMIIQVIDTSDLCKLQHFLNSF